MEIALILVILFGIQNPVVALLALAVWIGIDMVAYK